jgi:hypothetical protein
VILCCSLEEEERASEEKVISPLLRFKVHSTLQEKKVQIFIIIPWGILPIFPAISTPSCHTPNITTQSFSSHTPSF